MKSEAYSSLAIVIPVYNEEAILEIFNQKLCSVIAEIKNPCKIYYINDGSTDRTEEIISNLAKNNPNIRLISLSRNFGHQAALSCGLEQTTEDIVISIDGDGQNPPELIPEMLALYDAGYDIIIGQRLKTTDETKFKNFTSKTFYKLLNWISDIELPPAAADFRLLSRQVVDSLNSMPEYHRFLRGMVSWLGYKSVILPFIPGPRLGGESKYTFKKMLQLANDAIFSFSLIPLKIGLGVGGVFFLLAFIEVFYVLGMWLFGNHERLEPGWSSLIFIMLIVGGVLTTVISFIGIYIGYIFQEVKNRPIYVIKKPRTEDASEYQ